MAGKADIVPLSERETEPQQKSDSPIKRDKTTLETKEIGRGNPADVSKTMEHNAAPEPEYNQRGTQDYRDTSWMVSPTVRKYYSQLPESRKQEFIDKFKNGNVDEDLTYQHVGEDYLRTDRVTEAKRAQENWLRDLQETGHWQIDQKTRDAFVPSHIKDIQELREGKRAKHFPGAKAGADLTTGSGGKSGYYRSAVQDPKVVASFEAQSDNARENRKEYDIEQEKIAIAEAKEQATKDFIQTTGKALRRGDALPQDAISRYSNLVNIQGREGVPSKRAEVMHSLGLTMDHEVLRVDNIPKMESFDFRMNEKALIERGDLSKVAPHQMTSFLNMLGNQYAAEHRQRFMQSGLSTYDGGTPGDNARLGILIASEALSEYGNEAGRLQLEQHVWNQGPINRYGFSEAEMTILFKGNEQSKEEETLKGDGLVEIKRQKDEAFKERMYENYVAQAERYLHHPGTKPEYFDKYVENLESAVKEGNLTPEQLQTIKDLRKVVPDKHQVEKILNKPEIEISKEQFEQAKSIASSARHLLDLYRDTPISPNHAAHALGDLKRRLEGADPKIKAYLLEQLHKDAPDEDGYAYDMEPDTRDALFQFFTTEPSAALDAIEIAPPKLPSLDEMKSKLTRFNRIVENSHDKTNFSIDHIAEQLGNRALLLPKEDLKKLQEFVKKEVKDHLPKNLFSHFELPGDFFAAKRNTAAA